MLLNWGAWQDPSYQVKTALALQEVANRQHNVWIGPSRSHTRYIMPPCVVSLVRQWLPNASGHTWTIDGPNQVVNLGVSPKDMFFSSNLLLFESSFFSVESVIYTNCFVSAWLDKFGVIAFGTVYICILCHLHIPIAETECWIDNNPKTFHDWSYNYILVYQVSADMFQDISNLSVFPVWLGCPYKMLPCHCEADPYFLSCGYCFDYYANVLSLTGAVTMGSCQSQFICNIKFRISNTNSANWGYIFHNLTNQLYSFYVHIQVCQKKNLLCGKLANPTNVKNWVWTVIATVAVMGQAHVSIAPFYSEPFCFNMFVLCMPLHLWQYKAGVRMRVN